MSRGRNKMDISEGFRKLMSNQCADTALFVPLFRWLSGSEKNIEMCQRINKQFLYSDVEVLMRGLALNNKLTHFISYPKGFKTDEKTLFFYNDIAKYFGWTTNELFKNIVAINIENMKEEIADKFGYDDTKRKAIGLKKIKLKKGVKLVSC